MKITIGHLYPEFLNLYGDMGNILSLKHRLTARGIDAEIKTFYIDDEIDFSALDIVYIGAGGEKEQKTVCKKLCQIKDALISYAEGGGVILAVCSGLEILGKHYETQHETIEGVGLLDVITKYNSSKAVGNIVIENEIFGTIVGFENHAGVVETSLSPLGRVICGVGSGNNTEGVIYKNVIATYIHGPLLPKNPVLADYIVKNALENKGYESELSEIDDGLEIDAHNYAVGRFVNK